MKDRLAKEQTQITPPNREYVLQKWGSYIERVNPDGDHKNLHSMSSDIFRASGGIPFPNRDNFSVELPPLGDETYSIMLNERTMYDTVYVMINSQSGIDSYFIHHDKVTKRPFQGSSRELNPEEVGGLARNLYNAFKLASTQQPLTRPQT